MLLVLAFNLSLISGLAAAVSTDPIPTPPGDAKAYRSACIGHSRSSFDESNAPEAVSSFSQVTAANTFIWKTPGEEDQDEPTQEHWLTLDMEYTDSFGSEEIGVVGLDRTLAEYSIRTIEAVSPTERLVTWTQQTWLKPGIEARRGELYFETVRREVLKQGVWRTVSRSINGVEVAKKHIGNRDEFELADGTIVHVTMNSNPRRITGVWNTILQSTHVCTYTPKR